MRVHNPATIKAKGLESPLIGSSQKDSRLLSSFLKFLVIGFVVILIILHLSGAGKVSHQQEDVGGTLVQAQGNNNVQANGGAKVQVQANSVQVNDGTNVQVQASNVQVPASNDQVPANNVQAVGFLGPDILTYQAYGRETYTWSTQEGAVIGQLIDASPLTNTARLNGIRSINCEMYYIDENRAKDACVSEATCTHISNGCLGDDCEYSQGVKPSMKNCRLYFADLIDTCTQNVNNQFCHRILPYDSQVLPNREAVATMKLWSLRMADGGTRTVDGATTHTLELTPRLKYTYPDCTSDFSAAPKTCKPEWIANCAQLVASGTGNERAQNVLNLCCSVTYGKCQQGQEAFYTENAVILQNLNDPEGNICICEFGTAAIGESCPQNGATKCMRCRRGYHIVDDNCVINVCSCQNGFGRVGFHCQKHNEPMCYSCDDGYKKIEADWSCAPIPTASSPKRTSTRQIGAGMCCKCKNDVFKYSTRNKCTTACDVVGGLDSKAVYDGDKTPSAASCEADEGILTWHRVP